jgi:hypothetical protein
LLIVIAYNLFFGHAQVVRNEMIYQNHFYVGRAGTIELYRDEGYGLTSFAENGQVVNKQLDPKRLRIAFIGDSFVKAKQVSDAQKFTEIVERDWNAAYPNQLIQTVNLGQGGKGMADYLIFGPNMDRYFEPDLVFLFLSERDFVPLSTLEREMGVLSDPAQAPKTSRPVKFVNQIGLFAFFKRLQTQTNNFLENGRSNSDIEGTDEETSLDKPAASDTAAVRFQLESLKAIWGDRLIIIYYVFIPDMGRNAPASYDDELLAEIRRQQIPIVSLYQPFRAAFQNHVPPIGFNNSILGQGHLNRVGHQLTAETVIRFLEVHDDLF